MHMKINIPKINISKNLIPGAIILAAILSIGVYGYVNRQNFNNLSLQEASDKAIAFVNDNIDEGLTASLLEATDQGQVYKIHLKIAEVEYDSYITKDGKFLFPTGIVLESAAEATPAAEEATTVASADFAKCLTERGMKFYGSKDCSWCAKEKALLGDSLQYIDYVECIGDDGQLTKACQDASITSFPTWQMPDGKTESGYKTLEQLAEVSGCSL